MAAAVVGTIVRACLDLTRVAYPTLLAFADTTVTRAVDAALVSTGNLVAIDASKARVAVARAVETEAVVTACAGTYPQAAVVVRPTGGALAHAFVTHAIARAVMWTFAFLGVHDIHSSFSCIPWSFCILCVSLCHHQPHHHH